MKRKTLSKTKIAPVLEYHSTPSVIEQDGSIRWPAPLAQIESARDHILRCVDAREKTLIVPDKDADGLASGAILRHTLMLLGLPADLIEVHLISKGNTIHSEEERAAMARYQCFFIFVLDQGSTPGPPVIDGPHNALIIDHHHASGDSFPQLSTHVTACDSPPVATSSLLTYHICESLHAGVKHRCDWLCVVGTHGDLGNTLKWESPFPDMQECFKTHKKKILNDVVSLVNAPRRTATYDVRSAWDALSGTENPSTVLANPRLLSARQEVNAEVERCTHAAPKFSPDGKVAVFRIQSEAQVHPVIATRWAGHLQSKALEIVLVANQGYLPGKVNFSCRVPKCAQGRSPPVDIIASLKAYASLTEEDVKRDDDESGNATSSGISNRPPLLERLGDDFARGHVQASGGIVATEEFEELMSLMKIGVKPPKEKGDQSSPSKRRKLETGQEQQNKLTNYFDTVEKIS